MLNIYTPPTFQNKNITELHGFIKKHPFSTVVSNTSSLHVSHLPLILEPNENLGILIGHMAKGNNQWSDFNPCKPVLCIFHGPHAYTSPSWYTNLPEVPTWNYAVVHAEGLPQLITEKSELMSLIDQTITYFEPSLHKQTNKAYIPESLKYSQLDFIVGFKITITSIKGKFKLGQNRSPQDQQGITQGLSQQQDSGSKQLSEFICNYHARSKL